MNLWDWLFTWKPAPINPILQFPHPWLMRVDDDVFAVDHDDIAFGFCDEIAFCDGPEGPTR